MLLVTIDMNTGVRWGRYGLHEIFQQCWFGEKRQWLSLVLTGVNVIDVDERILYGSCSLFTLDQWNLTKNSCKTHCPMHLLSVTTVVWAHWLVQRHRIFWIWFRLCSSLVGQNWNCWAEICNSLHNSLRWWKKFNVDCKPQVEWKSERVIDSMW